MKKKDMTWRTTIAGWKKLWRLQKMERKWREVFKELKGFLSRKTKTVCERFAPNHPPQLASQSSMYNVLQRPAFIMMAGTDDSSLRLLLLLNMLKKLDTSSHKSNDGHLTNKPDSEIIRQHWCVPKTRTRRWRIRTKTLTIRRILSRTSLGWLSRRTRSCARSRWTQRRRTSRYMKTNEKKVDHKRFLIDELEDLTQHILEVVEQLNKILHQINMNSIKKGLATPTSTRLKLKTPEINVSPLSVQSPKPTRIRWMEKIWSISSSNSSNSSTSSASLPTTIGYGDSHARTEQGTTGVCTATREHAEGHGTRLLLAVPDKDAAEASELPQVHRRAAEKDARFKINRLNSTTLM